MNRNEKIGIFALIGIVGAAGIAVGLNITVAQADLTQNEVNAYISEYVKSSNGEAWIKHNLDLVDRNEFKDYQDELEKAISHPHIEIDQSKDAIIDIREDIQELKIEVAKLKQGNTGTGTNSQGSISITLDESCYEQGDVVTFKGMATPSRQLTSSIYKDKQIFEASPTTNSASNGEYVLYWVIPDHIAEGNYVAKLSDSGGKSGTTTVNVEDNC